MLRATVPVRRSERISARKSTTSTNAVSIATRTTFSPFNQGPVSLVNYKRDVILSNHILEVSEEKQVTNAFVVKSAKTYTGNHNRHRKTVRDIQQSCQTDIEKFSDVQTNCRSTDRLMKIWDSSVWFRLPQFDEP